MRQTKEQSGHNSDILMRSHGKRNFKVYTRRQRKKTEPENREMDEGKHDMDARLEGNTESPSQFLDPEAYEFVPNQDRTIPTAGVPGKHMYLVGPESKCMVLKLDINGHEVAAQVDTGAFACVMTESLVKRLELPIKHSDVTMNTIGENAVTVGGVTNAEISIQGMTFEDQEFLVYPHVNHDPNLMLLEFDFLKKNNIEVSLYERKLKKRMSDGAHIEWYVNKEGDVTKNVVANVPCVAARDQVIRKNETVLMDYDVGTAVKIPSDSLYLIDSGPGKGKQSCVGISPGICSSETKTVLMVSRGKDTVIKKGQVIAALSTIAEVPINESEKQGDFHPAVDLMKEVPLLHLSEEQRRDIYAMLREHVKVFSCSDQDIGRAAVTEHQIKLTEDTPIYQRPRRFPPPVASEIENQCQELYLQNIIEPSNSPWNSPIVPVRKRDGTLRLCIDYRKLNRVTIKDKFPMPDLVGSLYGLKGRKFFTSLDLTKGYYQVPLEDESRKYTAFSSPRNHWQFRKMGFGLANAPSSFQREIQAVLSGYPSDKVVAYLDDILIMSDNFNEHLELVSRVLNTLGQHGMKIKPAKCSWFQKEIEYLGHVVSQTGIRKTQKYVEAVRQYPRPETTGQLREFLGLINFQRKYVARCSELQKPLSSLTGGKRSKKLLWTEEMIESFEELKKAMAEDIELAYPDYSPEVSPLELYVDASAGGAGCYLAQTQEGQRRVIGFASMAFTPQQRSYSTLERELTALRWGVKTFKPFIYGVPFVLYTDHQPLTHLHNMKLVCARLARTVRELSDYNFEIRYVPGKQNCAADALSRIGMEPVSSADIKEPELPDGVVVDKQPAPGGGDSLFISLHRTLQRARIRNLPDDPLQLREQIADETLNNASRYGIKLDRQTRRNLRLMRCAGQLPSMELLLGASRLYEVRIFVYFWGSQPVVYQFDDYDDIIMLQCLGGVHFNPLVQLNGYSVPKEAEKSTGGSCPTGVSTGPAGVMSEDEEEEESIPEFCANIGAPVNVCPHGNFGQPLVVANVTNVLGCALLDTGAELCLITEEFLQKIEEANPGGTQVQVGTAIDMVGLTGKSMKLHRFVGLPFSIADSDQVFQHEFYLVDSQIIPYCMVLGADFLERNEITIECGGSKIEERYGVKLIRRPAGDSAKTFALWFGEPQWTPTSYE